MDNADSLEQLASELAERVVQLPPGKRLLIGIAGIPGAGKSTISQLLVSKINRLLAEKKSGPAVYQPGAIVVPMDGFHYANETLIKMGLLPLKGVPETFDAAAFVALLERLRKNTASTIFAPLFDRSIEASIENGITIEPYHKLCVVEGNYLLLEIPPWNEARRYFDEVWFLDVPLDVVYPRLLSRHLLARTPAEAKIKIESTDVPNAMLILGSKPQAHRLIVPPADLT